MAGLFSKPKAPAPPPTPDQGKAAAEAAERAREARRLAGGDDATREGTVLGSTQSRGGVVKGKTALGA